MYTFFAISIIVSLFFAALYFAFRFLRMTHVLFLLMLLGLTSLCVVSFGAEPPTDDPTVTVKTVKKTINVFLSTDEAQKAFIRLQKPDGTYLAGFRVDFTQVGDRSHAAFQPYLYNEDYRAVVFYEVKPIRNIPLK